MTFGEKVCVRCGANGHYSKDCKLPILRYHDPGDAQFRGGTVTYTYNKEGVMTVLDIQINKEPDEAIRNRR